MGGHDLIDEEMVAKAEAVIAAMHDSYLAWVEQDMARLDSLYQQAVNTDPAERPLVMKQIFSIAHDVKGQGGSFGYDLMTSVGNQLCRFVEVRQDWPDEKLAVVRDVLDVMHQILTERLIGDGGATGATLLHGLQMVVATAGGPLTLGSP